MPPARSRRCKCPRRPQRNDGATAESVNADPKVLCVALAARQVVAEDPTRLVAAYRVRPSLFAKLVGVLFDVDVVVKTAGPGGSCRQVDRPYVPQR